MSGYINSDTWVLRFAQQDPTLTDRQTSNKFPLIIACLPVCQRRQPVIVRIKYTSQVRKPGTRKHNISDQTKGGVSTHPAESVLPLLDREPVVLPLSCSTVGLPSA
jgi:hypothetical protein